MDIDIKKTAKLARLEIGESELEKFEERMTAILNYVENLPELPDGEIIDAEDIMELREDGITPSVRRDALFEGAPQVRAGCVVVPKIVGGE